MLRQQFISQPGLNEHVRKFGPDARPTDRTGRIGYSALKGDARSLGDDWLASLRPDTNLHEVLSLMGVPEPYITTEVHQLLDRATDRAIWQGRGETVGDLLEGTAPNLYEQLFDLEKSD